MNVRTVEVIPRSLMVLLVSILMVTVLVACGGSEPEADQEMQESETQETEMQEEDVEEVTLEIGTFVPHRRDFISAHSVVILPEILEEQSPGMFNIEHAGGPETFPPFELYGYVEDGTIDMASLPTAFYGSDIFLAVAANYPDMTPGRLREIGFYDWMKDLHAEHGVNYMGYSVSGLSFHCYTQEDVEEPEDLEDIPIYGTSSTQSLLEHFGAETVFMPLPELYTAIERGVVEGMCQPDISLVVNNEYYEHLNYMIEPGFFQLETAMIMNMDSWESLSDQHQEALQRGIREMERRARDFIQETGAEHREFLLEEQGMEIAEFEGDAADRWTRAARREFWYYLFEESDDHERIRELNQILQDAGYETYFPEDLEA